MSPRIRGIPGPYQFYFVSFDCTEPPHIHVDRERRSVKFWLEPVEICRNRGFSSRELGKIRTLVLEHHQLLIEAWDEHCNPK
ncbi:MAG: DUF4160 domain-containing protein [Candidatus Latescibacteria bacterium]|nr:DUF4160 domain-containing protein [Candidatus Latescibacterota bacterium]